jgi:hypothetical protein
MKVMAASARTSASRREELAAISRAVSPMIVVSNATVIRSTGSVPAPSSTAFCRALVPRTAAAAHLRGPDEIQRLTIARNLLKGHVKLGGIAE